VQIGDLARRVGVRVDTLRAWERRYGLLSPHRSNGGFRLYSDADEAVVRAMIREIDRGYPPSQAARLALLSARQGQQSSPRGGRDVDVPATRTDALRDELLHALVNFDGENAHARLDTLLREYTLNTALRDVLLPCLQQIGEGWTRGQVTIAEEHFASQLIRERLLGLARDWDQGRGPRALLSCPADERHDIGLICFGLVLSRSGWKITFLGPDTPVAALSEAAATLSPDLIVLAATLEERFASITKPLRALSVENDLALAGAGATPAVARATGATLLEDPPVAAAIKVAAHPLNSAHQT
jgi:MerR family transcriptional regulator, light-induced transcriptional regulator